MRPATRRMTRMLRTAPVLSLPVVAVLLLVPAGCSGSAPAAPSTGSAASSTAAPSSGRSPTASAQQTAPPQRNTTMNIGLTFDGHRVDAASNDSAAARDLAALLPLELSLADFQAQEKTADLPARLSTDGAPAGATPRAGDIAYYAPWGNLALYYRDAPYAEGLVVIGRMAPAGVAMLAEADHVTISQGG